MSGNRLLKEQYSSGSVDVTEGYRYNERNELTERIKAGSLTAYHYDKNGSIISEEEEGRRISTTEKICVQGLLRTGRRLLFCVHEIREKGHIFLRQFIRNVPFISKLPSGGSYNHNVSLHFLTASPSAILSSTICLTCAHQAFVFGISAQRSRRMASASSHAA